MRLRRSEKWTDWPLTVAAMLFLLVSAWPILQPGLDDSTASALGAPLILWAAFIVDYIVRVWLAEQRWRFVAHHVPDLVMLVLPMLRPLRATKRNTGYQAMAPVTPRQPQATPTPPGVSDGGLPASGLACRKHP